MEKTIAAQFSPVAVVTGGGSGLGQAIALQLAKQGLQVYIIGRRVQYLHKTCKQTPNALHAIVADISVAQGRKKILAQLRHRPIHYLIHNAAIVTPIAPIEKITLREWRKIHATNVEGPLFLTQQLLSSLAPQARILCISSDCAHYPLAHWAPYCTSKAALQMLAGCLKKELSPRQIHVGSVDPGMMYTPMQQYICEKTRDFPEKMSLTYLEQHGLIHSAQKSAAFCVNLLLNVSTTEFSQQLWQVT